MKLVIEPYNKDWPNQFLTLQKEIQLLLKQYNPIVEHFGSTAVPGLPAKPVIDILVGIEDISQFPHIVDLMLQHKSYIHYKVFDEEMPERRLFVRIKDGAKDADFNQVMDDFDTIPHDRINASRIAHVHVWEYNSSNWIRHIAFRDYLLAHDQVREKYGAIKQELGKKEWAHGMEYNDGKNAFLKEEEAKAIAWYRKKKI